MTKKAMALRLAAMHKRRKDLASTITLKGGMIMRDGTRIEWPIVVRIARNG